MCTNSEENAQSVASLSQASSSLREGKNLPFLLFSRLGLTSLAEAKGFDKKRSGNQLTSSFLQAAHFTTEFL